MSKIILERLAGIGEVTRAGELIARVTYSLEVSQDLIGAGKGGFIKNLKNVTGQITVVEGEIDLVDGKILNLILEDGRKWPFFAAGGDPVKSTFDCRSDGPLE